MTHRIILLCMLLAVLPGCTAQRAASRADIVISIVGTNDVHGELLPDGDRGGLVGISGFVEALRQKRAADVGAVLLIDAGDMWQGTLESNIGEGADVVAAYNSMGYAAAAIGNHEFDFGPAGPAATPQQPGDDPRGALKQRIAEAHFPMLAANLIDEATGRPVNWDNVQPSVTVDVEGVRIGIIGVMTRDALKLTIAANTPGLSVAPLAETIEAEAHKLRRDGADLIVVSAHAGSHCREFEDADDLASCDMNGEIMRVAAALPTGLVDHIVAGHVHQGIAHVVNGISVTSSYSSTRAFSRVDFSIDRRTGETRHRQVFPPQPACLYVLASDGSCASGDSDPSQTARAIYEGAEVEPDKAVTAIAERAAASARAFRDRRLGVTVAAPFEKPDSSEAPLGNLMTDALLASLPVDVALHNVRGGIRHGLPAGDLTYGDVYKMFPFDNRVVILDMSGKELREVITAQSVDPDRRTGFSGMHVAVSCSDGATDVEMTLDGGRTIQDSDRISVLVNDYLALGGDGILAPIIPDGGYATDYKLPLTRDLLVEWFRSRPGPLRPEHFGTTANPKWTVPDRCFQ